MCSAPTVPSTISSIRTPSAYAPGCCEPALVTDERCCKQNKKTKIEFKITKRNNSTHRKYWGGMSATDIHCVIQNYLLPAFSFCKQLVFIRTKKIHFIFRKFNQ